MRRGAIPPGKAGLVVLAAAAIPVVIGAAKPLARAVGRGLTKIGDKLQEAAAEAKNSKGAPPPPEPAANEDVVAEAVAEVVEEPVASAEAVELEAAAPPEPAKEPKKPKAKAEKAAKKKPPAPKAARKRPAAPEDFETA